MIEATKMVVPTDFKFEENIQGRINNLSLSPKSQSNTLTPLFEAVSNALHSIQERFKSNWGKKGDIRVEIIRDKGGEGPEKYGRPRSFIVTDNGIGLNGDNFKSFLTFDSLRKVKKGGKGVGRLTWLKVFTKTHIQSIYKEDGQQFLREFDFDLREAPVHNHKNTPIAAQQEITSIHLLNLKPDYEANLPQRTEAIAKKIIAHFLPFLISDDCPAFEIVDHEQTIDLRDMLKENKLNPFIDGFEIEGLGKFTINHVLLDRALMEGSPEHKIYFAAHGRIVHPHVVNNQMGLDKYFDYGDPPRKVAYVGIVSGDYLDGNVTQERNNFDIAVDTFKQISKVAEDFAKTYLAEPISKIVEAKKDNVDRVLAQFPRYQYLVKDSLEFSRELPLNTRNEEDIYKELSVHDFRQTRDIKRDVKSVINSRSDPNSEDDYQQIFDELVVRISDQEKSDLAQYVARRKAIIDLLETRLGFQDGESEIKYKEDAIHKIICPMRINSHQIEYGQHNLWLIDDRLAFYKFWASDKRIKEYAKSSESTDRPDLILFEGSTLLQRENTNQPVVIVEFKRPARKEYSDDENPLMQIYRYIKALREKAINDSTGKLITSIDSKTPFFCYVICDFTPKLLGFLDDSEINNPIPGGRGYFGYHTTYNAYIEVIQYGEIVKDARLRHEAFFKELGVN